MGTQESFFRQAGFGFASLHQPYCVSVNSNYNDSLLLLTRQRDEIFLASTFVIVRNKIPKINRHVKINK